MAYRFRKGRGQFTAGESRSGRGYNYAGRSVRISGDNFQLTWNGPHVAQQILQAIERALIDLSDEALAYMQSIVPVDTGELQESCFVQVLAVGPRIQVIIGASARHAVYVELGTSSHSAQPYIRPTVDFIQQRLPSILRDEIARRR